MSHNKVKVNGEEPNQSGEITIPFVSITGTPSTNDYLKYNGTNWTPVADTAINSGIGHIFIGQGESALYTSSPQGTSSITSTSTIYLYDTSPVNTISGATINKTGDWVTSVSLPAGDYYINAKSLFQFSASGVASYYVQIGSDGTQLGVIGDSRSSYYGAGDIAGAVFQIASTTTITFKFTSVTNIDTPANQSNTPAQYGLMYIEKLS